jgi:hypothetical protein
MAPEPAVVDEVLAAKPAGQMWRICGCHRPSYGARWADRELLARRALEACDRHAGRAPDEPRKSGATCRHAPILLDALTRGSVIGGWAKGDLVAFAFSLLRSERYFHPSLVSFGSFAGGSMARRIARVVAALVAAPRRSRHRQGHLLGTGAAHDGRRG